ncbi:MAG: hypothetical protein AB8B85_01115 [Paracoccaceae bacterium]
MQAALIFFAAFPFLQILPLQTYNQPYAIVTAMLMLALLPGILMNLPQRDRIWLVWLAIVGAVLFLFAALQGSSLREVQYLLAYISPVILVTAIYSAMEDNEEQVRTIIMFAILAWVSVSLIQRLISSDFMLFLIVQAETENLALNILESGRGVLSLAPEPTHHGFHMITLAATHYLLRGPAWITALAVADAILLAMSSSALMTLVLGGVVWSLLYLPRWGLLAAGLLAAAVGRIALIEFVDESSRIGQLVTYALEIGPEIVFIDYSINGRVFGVIEPVAYSIGNYLLPLGMSHETWMDVRELILSEKFHVKDLSSSGPASGYGLILFQGGLLVVPVLLYFFSTLCWEVRRDIMGFVTVAAFLVFLGQINLSTPSFSLVLAAAILVRERRAELADEDETPDPQEHTPELSSGSRT